MAVVIAAVALCIHQTSPTLYELQTWPSRVLKGFPTVTSMPSPPLLVMYTVTETETTVETRTIDVIVTSTLTAAGTVLPIPSQGSLTQNLTKTVTLEEVVTRTSTEILTLEEVVTRTVTKTVEEAMPTMEAFLEAFQEAFREASLEYLVNPWPELIIRHAYRFLSFVYLCSALVFVYSWLVWGLLLAGIVWVGFGRNNWFSIGKSDWFGNGRGDDGGAGVKARPVGIDAGVKPRVKLLARRGNIDYSSLVEARGVGVKGGENPQAKVRTRRASFP
jgi:hypothetical protein